MTINELILTIKDGAEWLQTTEGDEHECITLENLEGILSKYLNVKIKLAD